LRSSEQTICFAGRRERGTMQGLYDLRFGDGEQMESKTRYREGQRWEFKSDVPEFERTLVIGRVTEPHPEWGSNEAKYDVYVRYSPLARESIPPDFDGVVLSLTADGLDRSVTYLVESGVELPWWWIYGRRLARHSDAPGGCGVSSCDRIRDVLPNLFLSARQTAELARRRDAAIKRHLLKFKSKATRSARSQTVGESWARIVAWLKEHAPGYSFPLNEGASAAAIAAFEDAIGAKLPADFRESVQLHDGGDCWMPPSHGELLSLDQILEQWKMYSSWQQKGEYAVGDDWVPRHIKGPIKPVFWNQKRIQITDNSGDHLTLDLDPPNGGAYGQILDHCHEVGPVRVLAASWSEFLRQVVDGLESGKYVYFDFERRFEPLESQEH
jgi:cell wall assembly regulator SMI1